jgi:hypothetical protein
MSRLNGRFEAQLHNQGAVDPDACRCGEQVYLGVYKTPENAAHAYDRAALKFYGDDTPLNVRRHPLLMHEGTFHSYYM